MDSSNRMISVFATLSCFQTRGEPLAGPPFNASTTDSGGSLALPPSMFKFDHHQTAMQTVPTNCFSHGTMHEKDFEIDGRKKGPDSKFAQKRGPGCPNTEKGCSKSFRSSATSVDVGIPFITSSIGGGITTVQPHCLYLIVPICSLYACYH